MLPTHGFLGHSLAHAYEKVDEPVQALFCLCPPYYIPMRGKIRVGHRN